MYMRSIFWTLAFYELKIEQLLSTSSMPYLASQLVVLLHLHFQGCNLQSFLRNLAMHSSFLEFTLFLPFFSPKKASILACDCLIECYFLEFARIFAGNKPFSRNKYSVKMKSLSWKHYKTLEYGMMLLIVFYLVRSTLLP